MTADRVEDKSLADYRHSLIMALRLKDLPGERIGHIVAEVESHVADSGEDPTEAFGSAREYAARLTAGRPREPWWHLALTVVPAAIAGWFVAQGSFDLLQHETSLGLSGWVWLALGLIIAIPGGIRVYRRSTRVRDPRTGADMMPTSRWICVAVIGLPIATILFTWAILKLAGAH